jgi:tetratricopeptide (TPR) repeat protein
MSDNYEEETRPLFKLLRTPAFRFVIVCYNHYDSVKRLEHDLRQQFSERSFVRLDVEKITYRDLSQSFAALDGGFLWLENFQSILTESRDSLGHERPEMAAENERRRNITAGLNLRRDLWALKPVALFVFVRSGGSDMYVRSIMEKMPDLWSFRSLIVDLQTSPESVFIAPDLPADTALPIGKQTLPPEKQAELERLLHQLKQTPPTEAAYRLTLYPQITDLLEEQGDFYGALLLLRDWEQLAPEASQQVTIWQKKGKLLTLSGRVMEALDCYKKLSNYFDASLKQNPDDPNIKYNLAISYEKLGETHTALGNLQQALAYFEQDIELSKELYAAHPQNVSFKNGLAISCEKLGDINTALGNLQQALTFFEQYNQLEKELYEAWPQNVSFKNNLAISCEKLGSTHTKVGNLQQALTFFEERSRLGRELYEAWPQNVSFKSGLAISYSKLGDTHMALGNLQQALAYFEQDIELSKELYEAYPQKVSFKDGLAISYSKLGDTYTALGNLQQALTFFEQYNQLERELYEAWPQNVSFKSGVAISYERLGSTHRALGNLQQALTFLEQYNQIEKELYEAYPQNVSFKNGLAISYAQLGRFYRDQKADKVKAKGYFQHCFLLWKELSEAYPAYVQFRNNFNWVQKALEGLE